MKRTPAVLLVICWSLSAFYLGRWTTGVSSISPPSPVSQRIAPTTRPRTASSGLVGPEVARDELAELMEDVQPGQPNAKLLSRVQKSFDISNGFQRRARFQQLLSLMRPEDADGIHALFKAEDKRGRWFTNEYEAYWNRWGCVDGAAAVARMLKMDGKKGEATLWKDVISGWASQDAPAALAWVTANESDHLHKSSLWSALATGLSETDPEAGLALIVSSLPKELQGRCIVACANSVVQKGGIPEASHWLHRALANPAMDAEMSRGATSAIVTAVERAGHPALEELARTFQQNPAVQSALPETLAGIWRRDSYRILDFVALLPAEFNTTASLAGAIQQLGSTDLNRTGEWLKTHPSVPHYDTAAAEYAKVIHHADPEAAIAWVNTIKNPILRNELTT